MSKQMHRRMPVFILVAILFSVAVRIPMVSAAVPKCVLQLVNNSPSVSVVSGGQINYSYTLKNNGRGNCNGTSISAYYAGNEGFISSIPVASAQTNYYWQIGTLSKGETYNVNLVTKNVFDGNPAVNGEACASANGAADSCADTTTNITVSSDPDIGVPLVSTSTPPDVGTTTPPVISTSTPPVVSTSTPPIDSTSTPATSSTTPPISQSGTKEYGIWFWDSPIALSWAQNKQKIDAAKVGGFNVIYLTIDDRLTTNASSLTAYDASVVQFINYANQQGIEVDAESGWRDWTATDNRYKPYAIMDYVAQYNSNHTAKFRQLQYDIEPYLLPTYETNKAVVLTEYIDFVNELVARDTYGLGIQMVIPHFYGSEDGWTPDISYGGQTASTFSLLLSALDTRPNNSISVMSYRNTALGSDGTIDISDDEMQEIGSGTHSTKIIIAQETGNVTPSYVTFYGTTKATLQSQVNIINSTYTTNTAFQGIAVDYIDPFLALP